MSVSTIQESYQKTCVVTGGTGGIGLHIAVGLARMGYVTIVTGRNGERAEKAVERIRRESRNGQVDYVLGDLSCLEGVKQVAVSVLKRTPRVDLLVNNAAYLAPKFSRTADGLESAFAVNVMAPVMLTRMLEDGLSRSRGARVLTLTGGGPWMGLKLGALESSKGFNPLWNYNNTKRAMEAAVLLEAERLEQKNIFSHIVYPRAASTSMTQQMDVDYMPKGMKFLWPMYSRYIQRNDFGEGAKRAAQTTLMAAIDPLFGQTSGLYFNSRGKVTTLNASVYSEENQSEVIRRLLKCKSSACDALKDCSRAAQVFMYPNSIQGRIGASLNAFDFFNA